MAPDTVDTCSSLGEWDYIITPVSSAPADFSGSADVRFRGELQCRLAMYAPQTSHEDGMKLLQKQCEACIVERRARKV
jgi:hypothetical protein